MIVPDLPPLDDLPTELLIRLARHNPDRYLVVLHDRPTRDVLRQALALTGSPDPTRREIGVRILRELGPAQPDGSRPFSPETVPVLRALLATEFDPGVLGWTVSALGYHSAREALPHVLTCSDHSDAGVRFSVAAALPSLVDPAGVEPAATTALIALAQDEDSDIRFYALYALTQEVTAPDPAALATLARCLLTDPDPQVREMAAEHSRRSP